MKGLTFCCPMMKSWLAGNKSVTRRLMKPQPGFWVGKVPYRENIGESNHDIEIKPPYLPGEMVYIRETWSIIFCDNYLTPIYKADGLNQAVKWKSPLIMHEWASRSHALIVSVRPERVQYITEEDAMKEGVDWQNTAGLARFTARKLFQSLWESLYPGSWGLNDFVWRIELEKQ